nr:centrosomal protein of 164 kDa isoform X1 [Paramormyrops kingsleyae]XP_023668022.1 centrosomal protein of 164 kDa isoform X1 [Paramormyrops kingsleyae]
MTEAAVQIGDQLILEEEYDENYIPSEQEVHEYAREIGIDPEQEPELLWLAREGIVAPLPDEWKPCQDVTGDVYYFNFSSGQSTWDHPCDEQYRRLVVQEREKAQARVTPTKKEKEKKKKKERKKKDKLPLKPAGSTLGPLQSPLRSLAPLQSSPDLPAPSLWGSLRNSGGLEPLKKPLGEKVSASSLHSSLLGAKQQERVSLSLPGFKDTDEVSDEESCRTTPELLRKLELDLDGLGGGLHYEDSEVSDLARPEERMDPELQDLLLSADHSTKPSPDSLAGRLLHSSLPLGDSRDCSSAVAPSPPTPNSHCLRQKDAEWEGEGEEMWEEEDVESVSHKEEEGKGARGGEGEREAMKGDEERKGPGGRAGMEECVQIQRAESEEMNSKGEEGEQEEANAGVKDSGEEEERPIGGSEEVQNDREKDEVTDEIVERYLRSEGEDEEKDSGEVVERPERNDGDCSKGAEEGKEAEQSAGGGETQGAEGGGEETKSTEGGKEEMEGQGEETKGVEGGGEDKPFLEIYLMSEEEEAMEKEEKSEEAVERSVDSEKWPAMEEAGDREASRALAGDEMGDSEEEIIECLEMKVSERSVDAMEEADVRFEDMNGSMVKSRASGRDSHPPAQDLELSDVIDAASTSMDDLKFFYKEVAFRSKLTEKVGDLDDLCAVDAEIQLFSPKAEKTEKERVRAEREDGKKAERVESHHRRESKEEPDSGKSHISESSCSGPRPEVEGGSVDSEDRPVGPGAEPSQKHTPLKLEEEEEDDEEVEEIEEEEEEEEAEKERVLQKRQDQARYLQEDLKEDEKEGKEEREKALQRKQERLQHLQEEMKKQEEEEEMKLTEEREERLRAFRRRLDEEEEKEQARLMKESARKMEELRQAALQERAAQQRKLREECEAAMEALRAAMEAEQAEEKQRLEDQRKQISGELQAKRVRLQREKEEQMEAMRVELDEMVQQERREHEQKLEVLKEEHRRELDFIREKHSDEMCVHNVQQRKDSRTLGELRSTYPEQHLTEYKRELGEVLQEVRQEVQREHERKLEVLREEHRRELNSIRDKHSDEESRQRDYLLSVLQQERKRLLCAHDSQLEELRTQLDAKLQQTRQMYTLKVRAEETASVSMSKALQERDTAREEMGRLREEVQRVRAERDRVREEARQLREEKQKLESKMQPLQDRCDHLSHRVRDLEQLQSVRQSAAKVDPDDERKAMDTENENGAAPTSSKDKAMQVDELEHPVPASPLSPSDGSEGSIDDMRQYISVEGISLQKARRFLERQSNSLRERQAALRTARSNWIQDPIKGSATQDLFRNIQQETIHIEQLKATVQHGQALLRRKEERLSQLESSLAEELSDDDMERTAADRRVTFDVSESDLSSLEAHNGSGPHRTGPAKVQLLVESLQQMSDQLNNVLGALGSLAQKQMPLLPPTQLCYTPPSISKAPSWAWGVSATSTPAWGADSTLSSRWNKLLPGETMNSGPPLSGTPLASRPTYSKYTPASVRPVQFTSAELDGQRLQNLIDKNKKWLETCRKNSSMPLLTSYRNPASATRLVQLSLDENNQIKVHHY